MKNTELLSLYNGLQAGEIWLKDLRKIIYHDSLIVLVRGNDDDDDNDGDLEKSLKFAYICQNDERFGYEDDVFFSIDFSYVGYKPLLFCTAFKHPTMSGYAHKIVFKSGTVVRADSYDELSDGILVYSEENQSPYTKYDKEGRDKFLFEPICGKLEKIKGNFILFKNGKKYFLFNNETNSWIVPKIADHFTDVKFEDFYVEAEYPVHKEIITVLFNFKGEKMERIE